MILWIDIETTGLDPQRQEILEFGAILTDDGLNEHMTWHEVLGFDLAPNGWEFDALEMHRTSGLLKEASESPLRVGNLANIFSSIQSFLSNEKKMDSGLVPIGGSSPHFDCSFLDYHLPGWRRNFHYRNVDVSTIKNLCNRWYPHEFAELPEGKKLHRSLSDIRDTLEELRYYRKVIFR